MKLHEDKKLFREAVEFTAQQMDILDIYVEKDYWVTYALHTIFHNPIGEEAIFKGGTALSKCHGLIDRFSEDIDLVVRRKEGETNNQLKTKIKQITKVVSDVLPEVHIEEVTQKMGMIRKTAHTYEKEFKGKYGQVRDVIIVEATWLGNYEPYTTEKVSCYLADMMRENGQTEYIEKYNLQSFDMKVLGKDRTLCEKIMSLVRFSRQEKDPYPDLANKVRHIYDIHLMLKDTEIKNFFDSSDFDEMLVVVGRDDLISFKNNNEWLSEHPVKAIIFDKPEETWGNIKSAYNTTFKELVFGDLPKEEKLVATLKNVSKRLSSVKWGL